MKTVHHLDELLASLAVGQSECVLPPDGLGYLGTAYVGAMIKQAKQQYPAMVLWAHCGDDAALVMEAMREGLTHLSIDTDEKTFAKLADMAQQSGVILRPLHFASGSITTMAS